MVGVVGVVAVVGGGCCRSGGSGGCRRSGGSGGSGGCRRSGGSGGWWVSSEWWEW